MHPMIVILAMTASLPGVAQAQVKSRAIETPPGQASEPVRNPDDGDDLTPEKPVAKAAPSGALGRDAPNTVGVAAGAILIKTAERRLYFGLGNGRMRVYPVAVGKAGAQWKGSATIGRKAVNPTWFPTKRTQRRKKVPGVVRPGPRNPLGVRALYLSRNGRETLYRIHGTNAPGSIGKSVSSGCIRMRNADVIDLYRRVPVGTSVTVR